MTNTNSKGNRRAQRREEARRSKTIVLPPRWEPIPPSVLSGDKWKGNFYVSVNELNSFQRCRRLSRVGYYVSQPPIVAPEGESRPGVAHGQLRALRNGRAYARWRSVDGG